MNEWMNEWMYQIYIAPVSSQCSFTGALQMVRSVLLNVWPKIDEKRSCINCWCYWLTSEDLMIAMIPSGQKQQRVVKIAKHMWLSGTGPLAAVWTICNDKGRTLSSTIHTCRIRLLAWTRLALVSNKKSGEHAFFQFMSSLPGLEQVAK
jgi:hypothetical protein